MLISMLLTSLTAFGVGGGICVIAQLLIDKTALTPARILVLYVCVGVLLGATGLFEPLVAIAGCGITVPLLGFGGLIARGVREAVLTEGILGALSGGFTAAAVGCASALLFGYVSALCFGGRPKRISREG